MSKRPLVDQWKSTPEFSADLLQRERAVMECLESIEALDSSTPPVAAAAARLLVLKQSHCLMADSLSAFASFLNERRTAQSQALAAVKTLRDQMEVWIIEELWEPIRVTSGLPVDEQLGRKTQGRFSHHWKKAVRKSIFSEEPSDQTLASPGPTHGQAESCSPRESFIAQHVKPLKPYTISSIATRSGIASPASLYRWRKGETRLSPENIAKLARELDVKVEQIPN